MSIRKNANIEGLEKMAADFLQYRYRIYLHTRKIHNADWDEEIPDWIFYNGACKMIEAFGGEWRRSYRGGESDEEKGDPNNYSHWVIFPNDERCQRLNFDAWS